MYEAYWECSSKYCPNTTITFELQRLKNQDVIPFQDPCRTSMQPFSLISSICVECIFCFSFFYIMQKLFFIRKHCCSLTSCVNTLSVPEYRESRGSETHLRNSQSRISYAKDYIDVFIFYILFLNNNFKLCTKRFGQQQPVLCWVSHIKSSQWLHTQLQDFKTSERSWTGDHDTKWWWLMFSIALPVFFPSKAHEAVGPPEKIELKLISEIKPVRKKTQWYHKSARPNSLRYKNIVNNNVNIKYLLIFFLFKNRKIKFLWSSKKIKTIVNTLISTSLMPLMFLSQQSTRFSRL